MQQGLRQGVRESARLDAVQVTEPYPRLLLFVAEVNLRLY